MDKTTIYLPPDLKSAVKDAAHRRGVSEAEVIRDSIRAAVAPSRPSPKAALFSSGELIAADADKHLSGFGER